MAWPEEVSDGSRKSYDIPVRDLSGNVMNRIGFLISGGANVFAGLKEE